MTLSAALTTLMQAVLLALFVALPLQAQDPDLPSLHDIESFGRPADDLTFKFCVDPRDPAWELDLAVGKAIAAALLLEADPVILQDANQSGDISAAYRYLLGSCRAYFGFKLIPSGYADWAILSRPYYAARYVFATLPQGPKRLADLGAGGAIATRVGSSADIRFMQYNNGLASVQRWRRFPYSSDDAALNAVVTGTATAALIWQPSLAAYEARETTAFQIMDSTPITLPEMPVAAMLLSRDGYLRHAMDQAIDTLTADGSLARILAGQGSYAVVAE